MQAGRFREHTDIAGNGGKKTIRKGYNMEIGEKKISKHTVTEAETADKVGSGGLPVFSTPSMIALMEKTAFGLAKENGHDTVGTRLEISHLKACLPGTELTCEAGLTGMDGRKLTFRVLVSDAEGTVGEGLHERFIIDQERFMNKLAGK